jgi:phosphoketolase
MNVTDKPLTPELLGKMDAYCRAANYLSAGCRTQDSQVAERTSVRH